MKRVLHGADQGPGTRDYGMPCHTRACSFYCNKSKQHQQMVLKTAFISTKLVRVATTASDNQQGVEREGMPLHNSPPLKLIRSQRAESCNYCCCSIVCQFCELEQLLETANSLLKVDDSCCFCFRKVISVHWCAICFVLWYFMWFRYILNIKFELQMQLKSGQRRSQVINGG